MSALPTYGLDEDFPYLWAMAREADDKERLGRHVAPEYAEAEGAMRELWMARQNMAAMARSGGEQGDN